MRHTRYKTFTLLFFALLAGWINAAEPPKRQLVLVCAADSPITELSNKEARALFLGVTTVKNGVLVRPIRNASDLLVTEVFLQKVVFMSARNYERKLLHRVFRLGGTRPPVFKDVSELLSEVRRSPKAVTYMWADQVSTAQDVKSIGVLWKGTLD